MVVYCAQLKRARLLFSKATNEVNIKVDRARANVKTERELTLKWKKHVPPKRKKVLGRRGWSVLSPPEVQFSFPPINR